MIELGMVTHESITNLLAMPVALFFDVFDATAQIMEERSRAAAKK